MNSYIEYVKGLPMNPNPEIFYLHDNADITSAQNESLDMCRRVLSLQPRVTSGGGGRSREDVIADVVKNIKSIVVKPIDTATVVKRYPTTYTESMNTVLVQEVIRYNRLLNVCTPQPRTWYAH